MAGREDGEQTDPAAEKALSVSGSPSGLPTLLQRSGWHHMHNKMQLFCT